MFRGTASPTGILPAGVSFFFPFLHDHMPVPFFNRGLARGHLSVRGRRATLSPLGSFVQERERAQIFFRPLPDFLEYLPEMPSVVSEGSPISSWQGEIPFFFGFSLRFPGGSSGC